MDQPSFTKQSFPQKAHEAIMNDIQIRQNMELKLRIISLSVPKYEMKNHMLIPIYSK